MRCSGVDAESARRLQLESLARTARKRIGSIVGREAVSTEGPVGRMADILEALEWYAAFNERVGRANTARHIADLFEELTGEAPATESAS